MNTTGSLFFSASMLLSIVATSQVRASVNIVVPQEKKQDAGLMLAVSDLCLVIKDSTIVYHSPSAKLPDGDLIFISRPRQVKPLSSRSLNKEAFRIRPAGLKNRKSVLIEGDERGLMYGVFKLAERIKLGDDPFAVNIESAPEFPMRMFSEQGQLLNLPDRSYYAEKSPYVDETRLRKELDEAKILIDNVVRLGFNTITFLHVNFEDYVDYKYLDKPIYSKDDKHLVRSPIFCKYMTELCDYAHARHLDIFLQLYEIQYPPSLDKLYEVDLDSPNIQKIISVKCKELFERVPLDGLVITPTESHPRCGYQSKDLWKPKGQAGAGEMLTMYQNACSAVGKKAVFRLWRIASNLKGARQVCRDIPKGAMFSVKNTGGDYYLNSPLTNIVTSGIGHDHPLMVVFDTFRQYDGWSRAFCYVQQWSDRIRLCKENGVQSINAWGAWAPGCIWPDWEPGYMKNQDGTNQTGEPVVWAGHWNNFRMFTRGFTPGQASVYLLSRLCWDTKLTPKQIARDFTALHLGRENADAAAEALMHTQQAWLEHYPGSKPGEITHPGYIKWAMVFGPREKSLNQAYARMTLDEMLASNTRAISSVEKMENAFAKTDRSKAPDPIVYDRFKQGIEKTSLVLRSLHLYREYWWRNRADRDLVGKSKTANAKVKEQVRAKLLKLCGRWKKYPEEAGMWRMTYQYGAPEFYLNQAFPYWWLKGPDVTLEAAVSVQEDLE